jgi:hypothetical protein
LEHRGPLAARQDPARLFDEAIALANQAPCDPRTLTRAARDFVERNPAFAVEAGLAALRWLVQDYGYEITSADVWAAGNVFDLCVKKRHGQGSRRRR